VSSILKAEEAKKACDWKVPTTYGEVKYSLISKGIAMNENAVENALSEDLVAVRGFLNNWFSLLMIDIDDSAFSTSTARLRGPV
jgi:hypothetical protein